MSDKDERAAARRMENAVWPDGDAPALTKKSVKKQISRLVECLERVTLALQGIDVNLEKIADKKDISLPAVSGEDS